MVEERIASLTVSTQSNFIAFLKPFVKSVAESISFNEEDSAELGDLIQSLAIRLSQLSSDGDNNQSINLNLFIRINELVIAIEHKGIPVEIEDGESDNLSVFALSVQSKAIDHVRLINLGKSGQRLELSKVIPHFMLAPVNRETNRQAKNRETDESKNDRPLEIRLIKSSEGLNLSRCFFRVYGYTYGPGYVYDPELLKSLVEEGLLVSAVAIDSRGEFVAHAAIRIDKTKPRIGELISLAVDPAYRNLGLAKKIHSHLLEQARERKLDGLFGEAVTLHPYSQRLCLALSGKESAIMVGYVPPANYRQISEGAFTKRQMAMVYFFGLSNGDGSKRVFIPENHLSMIEKIYLHLNLKRILAPENVLPTGASCGDTAFDLKVNNDISTAAITINVYCPDTIRLLGSKIKALLESEIEYVYLDLPLSSALTPYFAGEFESMGLFFSGVIPYLKDGDYLRLQFLNTSQINLDSAIVVSDFGGEMSDYVRLMKERSPGFQQKAVESH